MTEELNPAQRDGTLKVGWQCTPAAFTKELPPLSLGGHTLEVEGDRLWVALPAADVDDIDVFRASLDAELRILLAACLPFTDTGYNLSRSGMNLMEPSGAQTIFLVAAGVQASSTVGKPDLGLTDVPGKHRV